MQEKNYLKSNTKPCDLYTTINKIFGSVKLCTNSINDLNVCICYRLYWLSKMQ